MTLDAEVSEVSENILIELVIRDIGLGFIPKRGIRVINYYMKQYEDLHVYPKIHRKMWLDDLIRYLQFFHEEYPKQLDQDTIIETLGQGMNPERHETILNDYFYMSHA
jgi:hypothetical protein